MPFYGKSVYEKLSTRFYEKYENSLTAKFFAIPRISVAFFFFLFCSFRNIVIKFYVKIFLAIIIILICQMIRFSITFPFNILRFSSNKKSGKEKLNKKSSLFKKFLELHLLFGFYKRKTCNKTQSPIYSEFHNQTCVFFWFDFSKTM